MNKSFASTVCYKYCSLSIAVPQNWEFNILKLAMHYGSSQLHYDT